MSDEESDHPASEADDTVTKFTYGKGGVPLYIGIVWVTFIVSYLVVMAAVALPDFIGWMRL